MGCVVNVIVGGESLAVTVMCSALQGSTREGKTGHRTDQQEKFTILFPPPTFSSAYFIEHITQLQQYTPSSLLHSQTESLP